MSAPGFPSPLPLRYLQNPRRDAFTSFLSAVAAGGIGLGVAALVVALAALAGMQRALRDEILERTPSVAVTPAAAADTLELERRIAREPEVVDVQRTLEGQGWVIAAGRAMPVRIVGYQGAPPRSLPRVAGAAGVGAVAAGGTEAGDLGDRAAGLYLADKMASRLAIDAGDIVQIASPRPGLTPLGPQPRLLTLRLEGVYRSGRTEDEPTAAMPLERAEILLGRGRAGRLLVSTRSLDDALALADRLRASLPADARVETWRELNRPLFLALTLERTVLFLAVSLIVAVAAMALYSDLQLVAATKRRELAVLSAMGADERALRRSFLLLGSLLGGGGAIAGGLLGAAAAAALDHWQVVRLPPGLLVFDALPFDLRAGDVLAVVGVTVLLTLACAQLGASRAARVVPAEALRG